MNNFENNNLGYNSQFTVVVDKWKGTAFNDMTFHSHVLS